MFLETVVNPPEKTTTLLFARLEENTNGGTYKWRLFEVDLDNLIKKDRGTILIGTPNILIRNTEDFDKLAYLNEDSLGSWIEIKNRSLGDSIIQKVSYHPKTDSTIIDDFYWYSKDTLLIELSKLTYKESIIDDPVYSDSGIVSWHSYTPVRVKSQLLFYDTKRDLAETFGEFTHDLYLLADPNENGIYFYHNRNVKKYETEKNKVLTVGRYWHFNHNFKYAVVRPDSETFTHFVKLETKDSVLVPQYNEGFLKKLKATEINSYSFRYDMDFINWDGSKCYYAFRPLSEPSVFVGLDENFYNIFQYDMKGGASKVVFSLALRDYFDSHFYPLLIKDKYMIAKKLKGGKWQYFKYHFDDNKEEVIFNFESLSERFVVFVDR